MDYPKKVDMVVYNAINCARRNAEAKPVLRITLNRGLVLFQHTFGSQRRN